MAGERAENCATMRVKWLICAVRKGLTRRNEAAKDSRRYVAFVRVFAPSFLRVSHFFLPI